MSEFKLNSFQNKTVEHILNYYEEHNVYLLADETGLGKTVIASEVAKRLTEKDVHSVMYIASNLDLANENIKKLKFDGSRIIEGRLSMLWKDFNKKEANQRTENAMLFALTPAVSLEMKGDGTGREREECENKYFDLIKSGNNNLFDRDVRKRIEIIRDLLGELFQKDGWKHTKYKVKLNKNRDRSTRYFQKISKISSIDKYRDVRLSHDYNKDINTISQEIVAMCLYENVWNYMYRENESGELDEILKLDSVRTAVSELFPKDSDGIGKRYYDILWNGSTETVSDNQGENIRELVDKISEKIGENWEKIYNEIVTKQDIFDRLKVALYYEYRKEFFKLIRCCMAQYSLEEFVKPDFVIIDEIQNYPAIFSETESTDEESAIVQSVLNSVLGKGDENKKVKILMLSATPYAYKNAIEVSDRDLEPDELDAFTGHLVGMKNILKYMKEQNNSGDIDIVNDWKDVQNSLRKLSDSSKKGIDQDLFEKSKKAISKLSENMLKIGISRSERPKKTYKPDDGKYTISDLDISEFANYFIEKKKPVATRLALSLPRGIEASQIEGYDIFDRDIKKIRIKGDIPNESSRIKALMNDLFQENTCQFLFIPPNIPTHKLEGIYENSQRQYGKTLLFSAYNAVPQCLQEHVNSCLYEKLIERSGLDKNTFEEKLNVVKVPDFSEYCEKSKEQGGSCEVDRICFLPYEKEIKEQLYKIFATDYAKTVILSLYGDDAVKDYVSCVDRYCIDGNLSAVMQEFEYMCTIQKDKPEMEKCLKEAFNQDTLFFSVSFCSSNIDNFEQKIRAFNNPFYPFAFFITSMAEEGHDFHWYSDRIVHWNVPASPISLIQREGRIDRADCFAIRKEIAEEMKDFAKKDWESVIEQFKSDKKDTIRNELHREMFPRFISGESCNHIHRMCYYYPLSSEYFRWEMLMKNLEFYRSMFGACDNDNINEMRSVLDEESWGRLKELELDIHIKMN